MLFFLSGIWKTSSTETTCLSSSNQINVCCCFVFLNVGFTIFLEIVNLTGFNSGFVNIVHLKVMNLSKTKHGISTYSARRASCTRNQQNWKNLTFSLVRSCNLLSLKEMNLTVVGTAVIGSYLSVSAVLAHSALLLLGSLSSVSSFCSGTRSLSVAPWDTGRGPFQSFDAE